MGGAATTDKDGVATRVVRLGRWLCNRIQAATEGAGSCDWICNNSRSSSSALGRCVGSFSSRRSTSRSSASLTWESGRARSEAGVAF